MLWFVYATISSFTASLSSIIEKKTLGSMHSIDFSLALSVLLALSSAPLLFMYPTSGVSIQILAIIFFVSIITTIAFLEVVKGVRHMEISESAPLFLLNPFVTALLAYIFLNESLSGVQLMGMGLLAFGTYILETKRLSDLRGFIDHFIGGKYARLILTGVTLYAVGSIIERQILGTWNVPPLLYLAIIQQFICVNFFIIAFVLKRPLAEIASKSLFHWRSLLLIGFLTFCYRGAFAFAVSLAPVALVVSIKRTSSLFTTIIGGELFHDHNILRKAFACTIMVSGVICMAFFGS